MGKVITKIRVENSLDYLLSKRGDISPSEVRFVEVEDALVDTGATLLCMSKKHITVLGLFPLEIREAETAVGTVQRQVYEGARLTIMGRTCSVDVMELPDGIPALVGYVPLENLDLLPEPKSQKLIPNPAHEGKMVMDLY